MKNLHHRMWTQGQHLMAITMSRKESSIKCQIIKERLGKILWNSTTPVDTVSNSIVLFPQFPACHMC